MNTLGRFTTLCTVAVALFSIHCGAAAESESETGSAGAEEAMGTKIPSNGMFGMTTFGGPGDYQATACGGNTSGMQSGDKKWYVANSQRFGCNKHLKLTKGTKCLVVRTADAGPATFVESNAGIPIMDSSPAVGKYFFGESGLGWSDVRGNRSHYSVHVAITTDPVGPCADNGDTTGDGQDTDAGDTGTTGSTGNTGNTGNGGGKACSHDGDCNPGNDGSGLICESNECVPGCHIDAQCPGNTRCRSGNCS